MASNQDDRSGTGQPFVVGDRGGHVMGAQCWGRGRCHAPMQHVGPITGPACGAQAAQDDPAVPTALAQLLCPRSPAHLRGLAQRGASAVGSIHPRPLADAASPTQANESQASQTQRQGQEKEGQEPGGSYGFSGGRMKNLPLKVPPPPLRDAINRVHIPQPLTSQAQRQQ
jgi:hypothetical protein